MLWARTWAPTEEEGGRYSESSPHRDDGCGPALVYCGECGRGPEGPSGGCLMRWGAASTCWRKGPRGAWRETVVGLDSRLNVNAGTGGRMRVTDALVPRE